MAEHTYQHTENNDNWDSRKIKSLEFLPENIQGEEFFVQLSEVVDYIIDVYHTKNVDILKALYDIKHSDFDYEKTLKLLGSENFIEFDVTSDRFKVLCCLLSNLYELKGTKKGLQYLLRLLDLDAIVHEWYDINEAFYNNDPKWREEVPKCSIVLELAMTTPFGICDKYSKWAIPEEQVPPGIFDIPEGMALEDTEGKFREFASHLLWVCVTLHEIRWMKQFVEYVDVTDTFAYREDLVFYEKYSPYVTNCGMSSLQVGYPVFPEYAYVGDPVKVGDQRYKKTPFVVRSAQQYNTPIDYDGWENTGFVGTDSVVTSVPTVGASGIVVGGNIHYLSGIPTWYKVGEEKYYAAGPDTYLVSGCAPSQIKIEKDVSLVDNHSLKFGIYVDPEHAVGGYIVAEESGDTVDKVQYHYIEETPETTSEFDFLDTAFFTSNISDLYSPLIVGDPTLFVGDTNLRIGIDYFFTDFEVSEETGFQEIFYTTPRQVGGFGYNMSGDIRTPLYVGTHYSVGGVLRVGDSEILVGTTDIYAGGGYGHLIGEHTVGFGLNYVGDCAPWDQTNIAQTSNYIYEILDATPIQEVIENPIEKLDSLKTDTFAETFQEIVFPQMIGRGQEVTPSSLMVGGDFFVGQEFIPNNNNIGAGLVGDGEFVGGVYLNTLKAGVALEGDYVVSEDSISKLEVNKEIESFEGQINIDVPIVGMKTVGGNFEHSSLSVGESEVFVGGELITYSVGDAHQVGQIQVGGQYVNAPIIGGTYLNNLLVGRDLFGKGITKDAVNLREEFGNVEFLPQYFEQFHLNTYEGSSYFPQFIGIEENSVDGLSTEALEYLSYEQTYDNPNCIISDSLFSMETDYGFSEQFNANLYEDVPNFTATEGDDVILLNPQEGHNPEYLMTEQMAPYGEITAMNLMNAYRSSLTYTITED